jgi:hypothetical protein
MFTPGILKEIMQMTNPNQKVQARDEARGRTPAAPAIGNSSSEPMRGGAGRAEAQTIDGWSSQQQVTTGNEGKGKKQ